MLRAIMDISARAISLAERPRAGQMCQQYSPAPGRPNLHLVFILSQTSAGKVYRSGYVIAGSSTLRARCVPRVWKIKIKLTGRNYHGIISHFEVPTMSQNAPSDAGQLVGERNREHVRVQPLLGGADPGFESMALPALWPDQDNPRRLYEQQRR